MSGPRYTPPNDLLIVPKVSDAVMPPRPPTGLTMATVPTGLRTLVQQPTGLVVTQPPRTRDLVVVQPVLDAKPVQPSTNLLPYAVYTPPPPEPPTDVLPPVISGATILGSKLTATPGTWENGATSYAYQWQRCDSHGASPVAIAGATTSSYTCATADLGHTLRVVVIASNSVGPSEPETSEATAVVIGPPANTSVPVIVGTPRQGETLSASPGAWTESPEAYDFHWQRGPTWTTIPSAVAPNYVCTAEDVGHQLRVTVTAENEAGETTATSTATASVEKPPEEKEKEKEPPKEEIDVTKTNAVGWGANNWGSLSQGFKGSTQLLPKHARGVGKLVEAWSTGETSTVAMRPDGTVLTGGANAFAELGRGANSQPQKWQWTLSLLPGLNKGNSTPLAKAVVGLAAGAAALMRDGSLKVWGNNSHGQLGNGETPTQEGNPAGYSPIAVYYQHTGSEVPKLVEGVTAIWPSIYGFLYTKSDGSLWCQGGWGFLGNQLWPTQLLPAGIFASPIKKVASSYNLILILLTNGQLWAMGDNQWGELGTGAITPHAPRGGEKEQLVQVAGLGGVGHLTNVVDVACTEEGGMALLSNGTVATWGRNNESQLGRARNLGLGTITSFSPVISGLASTAGIKPGEALQGGGGRLESGIGIVKRVINATSLELEELEGSPTGWEHRGATFTVGSPIVKIQDSTGVQVGWPVQPITAKGVVVIPAGTTVKRVITEGANGEIELSANAGRTAKMQIGFGGPASAPFTVNAVPPTLVSGISTGVEVSAGTDPYGEGEIGSDNVLVRLSNNTLMGWGANSYGQLATGDTSERESPVPCAVGFTFSKICAGGTDCWGILTSSQAVPAPLLSTKAGPGKIDVTFVRLGSEPMRVLWRPQARVGHRPPQQNVVLPEGATTLTITEYTKQGGTVLEKRQYEVVVQGMKPGRGSAYGIQETEEEPL